VLWEHRKKSVVGGSLEENVACNSSAGTVKSVYQSIVGSGELEGSFKKFGAQHRSLSSGMAWAGRVCKFGGLKEERDVLGNFFNPSICKDPKDPSSYNGIFLGNCISRHNAPVKQLRDYDAWRPANNADLGVFRQNSSPVACTSCVNRIKRLIEGHGSAETAAASVEAGAPDESLDGAARDLMGINLLQQNLSLLRQIKHLTARASEIEPLQLVIEKLQREARNPVSRGGLTAQECREMQLELQQVNMKLEELASPKQIPDGKVLRFYVKKAGFISMDVRQDLIEKVALHGSSFRQAYPAAIASWRICGEMLAQQQGTQFEIMGAINSEKAQDHAAISSVAMGGRLVEHVLAYEISAVISGDGRVEEGKGLTWCEKEREACNVQTIDDIAGAREDSQMSETPCTHSTQDSDSLSHVPLSGEGQACQSSLLSQGFQEEASSLGSQDDSLQSQGSEAAELQAQKLMQREADRHRLLEKLDSGFVGCGRSGAFLALAFDGTSTWWNRSFIALACRFKLGGLSKTKMCGLLEKIEVTSESGAAGYVQGLLGWVGDIRALQKRQGETENNLLSIYDFAVWMVLYFCIVIASFLRHCFK